MKLFHQLDEDLQTKVLALCTTKIIESIQNSTFDYDEQDLDISALVERIRSDDRLSSEDYNEVHEAITEILKDKNNSDLIEDLSYDVATRSYYAEGDDNVIFLPDVNDEDYACDNCSDKSCKSNEDKPDDSTEFGKKFTDDVKKKFNLN